MTSFTDIYTDRRRTLIAALVACDQLRSDIEMGVVSDTESLERLAERQHDVERATQKYESVAKQRYTHMVEEYNRVSDAYEASPTMDVDLHAELCSLQTQISELSRDIRSLLTEPEFLTQINIKS